MLFGLGIVRQNIDGSCQAFGIEEELGTLAGLAGIVCILEIHPSHRLQLLANVVLPLPTGRKSGCKFNTLTAHFFRHISCHLTCNTAFIFNLWSCYQKGEIKNKQEKDEVMIRMSRITAN